MSADLDASVTFSRAVGGPLELAEDAGFILVAIGTPTRVWSRRTVEGRYQHGRRLVSAVLAQGTLKVQVRVVGTTWVQAAGRWNTLLAAVSARSFTATVTIEGVSDVYTCEPADTTLAAGENLDPLALMLAQQEYVLTVPVMPL